MLRKLAAMLCANNQPTWKGRPMATLDTDMKAIVEGTILCFAATTNPDGSPNLSPASPRRCASLIREYCLSRQGSEPKAGSSHRNQLRRHFCAPRLPV